ncbi:Smr/MutS family protein [Riemerella anatipestifer]|uniref:Smr/MutS family protein n=1 Tax=Riemerella anatipestifer TaxID=34085 RepID=UPI00285638DA|nr:Smr/MutS family protein [Riemerella anatipestifer]MDR7743372.1 DNA mismatch repair protein [Riemerella anatipestifer]
MKIGDNVSVIDDDLWGIVTSIHGNEVVFRDEYHFTHRYPKHLLTLRDASLYEQTPIVQKPEANQTSRPPRKKNQHLILDLHFDQLVNNPDHYDSFERLFIQKQKLEETLDFCKFNKIKKLEIIHGIGDGVLQKLVFDTLKSKTNIEFEESNFFYHQSGSVMVNFI